MTRNREVGFAQSASSLFVLFICMTIGSIVVIVPARAQSSTNSGQTVSTDGGVMTPQQKYCPPDDPTCYPFPTNRAPTISWTQTPANGSYFLPSGTISLGASASDPDGSISHVEFVISGESFKSDTTSPYSAQFTNLSDGAHSVYAIAFDNEGRTTQSSTLTIYVVSGTLTASPSLCNIPQGGTVCSTSISWTSSSSSTQVWVSSIGSSTEQLFASGQSGQAYASWISAHGDHFMLKSNGLVLASVDVRGVPPPTIAWTQSPSNGQYLLPTDTIPLAVTASERNGSIAKVEFVVDGSIQSTDAASPYQTQLSGLSAGSHAIRAIAFDNQGRSSSTGTVTFNIRNSVIIGHIDGVSTNGVISGWACSTYLAQSINVDLYLGGSYGSGTGIARYTANKTSEPAVAQACKVSGGSYRFQLTLTKAQRQEFSGQSIYVYGISPVGNGNRLLGGSGTLVLPDYPPPEVASTTSFAYDELGRVIAAYDSAGHLKASYTYDANGNVTSVTDALNHATLMTYDALGRVSTVTDADNQVTTYHYDVAGRVTSVTDPRHNTTSYTYDGFGQLWEKSSPDTGITTYNYASDGQLQGYSRADGTLITYTYDSLGRPTSITTGTQTRHMAYDSCTNGIGRVCSVSDATGTTSYTYDPQGDITQRHFTIGSTTYALGYSYDSSGRLATLTYPDGNQAGYHYQDGRLSGITATVNGSAKTVASSLTYRGGDRLLTSWTAGNGRVNSYTYDGNGQLTDIQVPGIQSLSFTYDAANRITDITNGIHPSLSQTFTYDALSRLTQVTSPSGNQSYTYDANGNRTSQAVDGVTTPLVIQPDSNRLASVGGQAIGYDANGNTTMVDGVVKYHYDSFNRLVSAGGMTYYINPEGQRLRKSGPAGTTYFAPDRSGPLLADEPDGIWKDYVWMGGRMVGMITSDTVYALHSDQTGRVLAITNPSGAVAWEAEGLAFDRNTTSGNSAFFRLGFPGQYWDVEDSLWHNGFRDYDPTLGRYIESDPVGLSGGLNSYVYVESNPVSFIDSMGLSPGDSFRTPEEAALDALNYISLMSDKCDREYGGWVYKEWSLFGAPTYTYDKPIPLGETGGEISNMPEWHETVAMFHNHPLITGYDYNHFSFDDKESAAANRIPSYLLIPNGSILRFIPGPGGTRYGGSLTSVGQSSGCGCKK